MDDVQLQLANKSEFPTCAGVALCGLDTEKKFRRVERSIRQWAPIVRETFDAKLHTPVGILTNRNSPDFAQVSLFPFCNCKQMCTALPVNFWSFGNID